MYQTINVHQFRQAFIDMDRKENFSYQGLEALYNFLEELAEDTGEEMELDVIAICCDFSEHTIDEIIAEYPDMFDDEELSKMDDEGRYDHVIEVLNDETMTIPVDEDKVIIQAF